MSKKKHLSLDDWIQGNITALSCLHFRQDVEEEWIAEETISCYNCRYRRWVQSGIQCMKTPME